MRNIHRRWLLLMPIALAGLSTLGPASSVAQSPKAKLISNCLLIANGRTIFSGPCYYEARDANGSFIITERSSRPYFAFLIRGGTSASGHWNGARDSGHAQYELGTMTRKGGCWQNRDSKICAWR